MFTGKLFGANASRTCSAAEKQIIAWLKRDFEIRKFLKLLAGGVLRSLLTVKTIPQEAVMLWAMIMHWIGASFKNDHHV